MNTGHRDRQALLLTRHRASTSMYSLTFCVRFLLPLRHQWKARIPDCRSNVENAPVGGGPAAPASRMLRAIFRTSLVTRRSPASSARRPRLAGRSHYVVISRNYGSRYVAIATQPVPRLQIRPIVHKGSLYHAPSYIRVRAVVWAYGRGQSDRQTHRRE